MYCRPNQYIIEDSLAKNNSGSPFKQVVPFKKRCGSMNPYTMHPNDKCYCDEGSVNNKKEHVDVMKGIFLHSVWQLENVLLKLKLLTSDFKGITFIFVIKVGGLWVNAEILNIPWSEDLLDPITKEFKAAKSVIETEVMTNI